MKPGNFEPDDVAYLSRKGITITHSRTFPDGGILHFGSVRPSVELITPARRAAAEPACPDTGQPSSSRPNGGRDRRQP